MKYRLPADKRKHFRYGALLSALGILWWPLLLLGFIAGVVKEIIDLRGYGTPDHLDMAWTWYGALIGCAIALGGALAWAGVVRLCGLGS